MTQTYVVVGTTLKYGGELYPDGSLVELPEDVAARCRVRPAEGAFGPLPAIGAGGEKGEKVSKPIEELTKAELVEMGAGIGLELDGKCKRGDLMAALEAELERLAKERPETAE